MSDNGAFCLNRRGLDVGINTLLRSGGITCWEGGIRVAALARWPGRIKAGSIISEPCWSPDLLVTFAALADAKLPKDVVYNGQDITKLLTASAPSPHKSLFFKFRKHTELRMGDWKIVREQPNQKWQLFNLKSDIGERNNLAAAEPAILKKLE